MGVEFLAVLSGLAAAFAWGTGDFSGGLASRRANVLIVLIAAELIGSAALVVLGVLLRQPLPAAPMLLWSGVAGLAGGLGLLLLYYSLSVGKMGVVAPVTAVAAGGIPLLAGVVLHGWPGAARSAGFALALAAIWTISAPGGVDRVRPRDLALPLLAGVGFGVFLTLIGRIGPESLTWSLVAARVGSIVAILAVLAVWRPPPAEVRRPLPWRWVALAGIGDVAGNAFFALSSAAGRLDVAAVLGSLYPAATVVLARLVLHERLTPRQNAGVLMALAAVALIAL